MRLSDSENKKSNEEVENLTKVTPRFTAWMEDDKIIVRVVLPGVERKNIEMKALQDRFLLRARRENLLYDLDLGLDVDIEPDNANAEYKEGLLRIELIRHNPLDDAYNVPIQ
jgi:HSP20 family molecular chaperone IbpA